MFHFINSFFLRLLFGVCDNTGLLEYGQAFVRITINGVPQTLKDGYVIVSKNPCYHIGDIRKLKVVDIPNSDHLIDCIVFPTKGIRPHPSEIAGSDLDGIYSFLLFIL